MRTLAVLLAGLMLLAGCTDDATPADEPTGPDPEPGTDPEPTGNASNAPPTLSMALSIRNGTAPFNTTITLTGDDADGDALAWEIFVNNASVAEGSGLPANHSITIETPGNHSVLATVSDGNHTVEALDTIQAVLAVANTQSVDGEIVGESTACTEGSEWAEGEGVVVFDIIQGTIGQPYFVEFTENSAYHRIIFVDADDATIEEHMLGLGIGIEPGDVDDGDWEMGGTVPDATARMVLIACGNIIDPVDHKTPFTYDAGPDV